MKFDNVDRLLAELNIKMSLPYNYMVLIKNVLELNFGSLNVMNDKTKVKTNDFYDPTSGIYYTVKKVSDNETHLDSNEKNSFNNNVKCLVYDSESSFIFMQFIDKYFIIEKITPKSSSGLIIQTKIYDEKTTDYLERTIGLNQKSYKNVLNAITENGILPDIELDLYERKTHNLNIGDVEYEIDVKSLNKTDMEEYRVTSNNTLNKSIYSIYKEMQMDAIENYKVKRKKLFKY